MDTNSASGKTNEVQQTTSGNLTKDGMSPLVRYVLDGQAHERFAVGERSERAATKDVLQDWEKVWQEASEHSEKLPINHSKNV
ncbi:hypothetical protein AAE478_008617 [Parahypoxylon ruwenzoriense]